MFCKKNRMAVWSLCLSVVLLWGLAGCSFSQKDQTEPGSAVQTDTGSAAPTTEAIQPEPEPEPELPASQQENEQHAAVMEDPDAPAYAKEYPGLYSDAIREPNVLHEEKVCYLTFDDGPSSTNTPGILDVLKQENVKATFFVVTSEINEETQPILQRIVDEGHTLCIHANEHAYGKLYASTEAYLADFAEAYDKIYDLTGYRVQGFRFPGGSNGQVNSSGCYHEIVTEMTRRGFEYYDWNAYDHDAEGGNYSVEQMVQFAVHEVNISSRNDTIMLLHDTYGKEKTVQALPSIIRQLKDAGIQLLPIDNTTRPVHFYVSDSTPPEYVEPEPEPESEPAAQEETEEPAEGSAAV